MTTATSRWNLEEGETLLWEGRPAPRCYVFRHWLQALIGTVLFLACSFWLMVGIHLVRSQDISQWLLTIPGGLVLGSFFIGPGQLLFARWHWEKIFYAVTDRRLLVQRSLLANKIESFAWTDFKRMQQKKYGKKQVSFRLSFDQRRPVILECLEHAEIFRQHLPPSEKDVGGGLSV